LAEVAHKLNVGAVLEGSVRKDGNHARIAAQLINAVTGFQLWSQTYDRDLRNVLSLQTEIATAVTKALQATLLADAAAVIEQGGTQNPQAFDAYLRGKDILNHLGDKATLLASIAAFDEATRLDHGFAKAYAEKAIAESNFAEYYAGPDVRKRFQQARATAERALALAPELGAAHAAIGRVLWTGFFEFDRALAEYQRALALSPNDADVLMRAGQFFSDMGRADAGVTSARRGVALDQLNHRAHSILGSTLEAAHRHREAIEAFSRALALNQNDARAAAFRGLSLLGLGEFESARQSCATPPLDWKNQLCLAIAYDKLHRRREAEAELSAMKTEMGDAAAYQYAEIYAQWGDVPKALDWIETAYRLRDSGLSGLKADPFLDPLRDEPRFQAIERKLKFPA
jgi:tetratricopeptide (TPR) repeat protein